MRNTIGSDQQFENVQLHSGQINLRSFEYRKTPLSPDGFKPGLSIPFFTHSKFTL